MTTILHTLTDKDFHKRVDKELKDYDEQPSRGFVKFCASILLPDLSKEELEYGVEGLHTNDDSIDFFWADNENQVIYIIQGKYEKPSDMKDATKAQKTWGDHLLQVHERLYDYDYISNHTNLKIRDISEEYLEKKDKGYATEFKLCHLGTSGKDVKLHYSSVSKQALASENNLTFDYLDKDKLKDVYLEVNTRDADIPENVDVILLEGSARLGKKQVKHNVLFGALTGTDLIKLRKQHGYALFDKNIRYHLGKANKVNKEITKTAIEIPTLFFYYNNGITIIADKFKLNEETLKVKLTRPQIINGAQTVESIYHAFSELLRKKISSKTVSSEEAFNELLEQHFSKLIVLMRIIERTNKENVHFEADVIRYNNTQSQIKTTDFFSLKSDQRAYQKSFFDEGYFYEIKRGEWLSLKQAPHSVLQCSQSDFGKSCRIQMDNLSKILMAWRGYAAYKFMLGAYAFENDEMYREVFFNTSSQGVELFTKDDIRECILAFNIMQILNDQTKLLKKFKADLKSISSAQGVSKEKKERIIRELLESDIYLFHQVKLSKLSQKIVSILGKSDREVEAELTNLAKEIQEIFTAYDAQIGSGSEYYFLALIRKIIIKSDGHLEHLLRSGDYKNKENLKRYLKGWYRSISNAISSVYSQDKDETKTPNKFYKDEKTIDLIFKELDNSVIHSETGDYGNVFPLTLNSKALSIR
ncbi:MAG: AIPR family protein [Vampirovibrionales bacterium]|nr:AIPR family protein [Vampirovibrionales bacterium]